MVRTDPGGGGDAWPPPWGPLKCRGSCSPTRSTCARDPVALREWTEGLGNPGRPGRGRCLPRCCHPEGRRLGRVLGAGRPGGHARSRCPSICTRCRSLVPGGLGCSFCSFPRGWGGGVEPEMSRSRAGEGVPGPKPEGASPGAQPGTSGGHDAFN